MDGAEGSASSSKRVLERGLGMNAREPMFIHYVGNMARAVAFYRGVLGLQVMMESPGWSMLRCGDCTIGLHQIYPQQKEGLLPHAGLNLRVDDLDGAVDAVKAGGGEVVALRPASGGVPFNLALIRDTEGNALELREAAGASGRP